MAKPTARPIRVLTGSISVAFDTWLPYASGTLVSYAKSKIDPEKIQFLEPLYKTLPRAQLLERLSHTDVLALTCYVWNESINESYTKLFKSLNPEGIVIWGGPNIPKAAKSLDRFVRQFPDVDCFVTGPGEEAFVSLLNQMIHQQQKHEKRSVPKTLQAQAKLFPEGIHTNAYLDGTFDSILARDKSLKVSFETNRGCPYSCSFCDWGGQSNSRIIPLSEDLTHRTIDFLFSFPNIKEIEILDANFGMFKRDLVCVEKMFDAKKRYQTDPNISYSGLAKNGSKYLPPILNLLHKKFNMNNWQLKVSFQTHSQNVLDLAQRQNIKNEKLVELLQFGQQSGLSVCSEMIMGLPGETADSWAKTLAQDIQLGIERTRAYILTVSENTLIADPAFIKDQSLKFKNVYFPDFRDLYQNQDLPSEGQQRHRVVFACNSYDLDELKKMYSYWWFHHTFYNAKLIPLTLANLIKGNTSYSQLIDKFLATIPSGSPFKRLHQQILDFVEVYFKEEAETFVDDYEVYRFASGAMRFSDIIEIKKYKKECGDFITEFFLNEDNGFKASKELLFKDLGSWDTSITDKKLRGLSADIRSQNVERNI